MVDDGSPRGPDGRHRPSVSSRVRGLVTAIRSGDDHKVEQAVLDLSGRNRLLAPLALVVGAFVMLFQSLRLIVTNWRLTLLQVLPALVIWLAMLDLKIHALRGRSFAVIRGPLAWTLVVVIALLTAAAHYLDGVFAFAIARPGSPDIRDGFRRAWRHRWTILGWGGAIGLALGFSAIIVPRWGGGWFVLAMGATVGVAMFAYVAIPSRLLGLQKGEAGYSRRDRLAASTVGGIVGAVVCTPPYLLGRLGIVMLGWGPLWLVGAALLAVGAVLQAGAQGSVNAIKMSLKIMAGAGPEPPATPRGA